MQKLARQLAREVLRWQDSPISEKSDWLLMLWIFQNRVGLASLAKSDTESTPVALGESESTL